jgi:CheY-like chemotaxis protein
VVWGTVQDHDGYIDVASQPNKGTTFSIYLPATRENKARKPEPVPAKTYEGNGQVILIVDDVEEQREIATNILEMLNYQPVSVASGETAIEFLKTKSADLILLDMVMEPGLDGLETFKHILTIKPDQKAIVVSGYTQTSRVEKLKRLGAQPFIKKPYAIETLGMAIKCALNN